MAKTKAKPQKAPDNIQAVKIRFLEARVTSQATEIRELQAALAHALPGVWASIKRYLET